MVRTLTALGLWLLAAALLFAPMTPQLAGSISPGGNPRYVGYVGGEPQTVGDVVAAERSFRDIRFAVQEAGLVEVTAKAAAAPFDLQMLNADGKVTASAHVAAMAEVRVEGAAQSGRNNRIRLTPAGAAGPTPFELTLRTTPED